MEIGLKIESKTQGIKRAENNWLTKQIGKSIHQCYPTELVVNMAIIELKKEMIWLKGENRLPIQAQPTHISKMVGMSYPCTKGQRQQRR